MPTEEVKENIYNKIQIWPDFHPKVEVSSRNLTDEEV